MEGGLVAQQVGIKSSDNPKGCPARGGEHTAGDMPNSKDQNVIMQWYRDLIASYESKSSNYCEFRDTPDNNGRSESITYTIHNPTSGDLSAVIDFSSTRAALTGNPSTVIVRAGQTETGHMTLIPVSNYTKDGNTTANLNIGYASNIWSCTVTVIDDDNSAYVGRRNHHPHVAVYGSEDRWNNGSPHCYDVLDCAYD